VRDDRTRTAQRRTDQPALRLLIAAALVAASVYVTLNAWQDIAKVVRHDEQASHVLVVPLAVIVLLIARARRFSEVRLSSHWLGPAMAFVGIVSWAISYHYEFQIGWHGGALLAAVGCFVAVTGLDPIRKLMPAFVFLVFLLPVPQTVRGWVTQPLQDVAATVSARTAEVLGMDVMQSGRALRINGQDVTVAEACAGMRMVFTLFMTCFVSAYSLPLREPVRWVILLLAPGVAIAANVVRLVLTLWAYNHFAPETADRLHTFAGWVMVVLAFVSLDQTARFLQWLSIPVYKPEALRAARRSHRPARVAPRAASKSDEKAVPA
jgi:exosortase